MGLHRLVQRPGAEASPDDQHDRFAGLQPEMGQRLGFQRGGVPESGETAAQRIARQHDPIGREKALHALVGYTDAPGPRREQLVRNARIGVLLLNQRRNAHPLRAPQHRSAGVPPEADDHIGPEAADHPSSLDQRREHLGWNGQVAQRQPPLQSRHGQADDRIAKRRHLLHLHLALGPDEQDVQTVVQPAPERLGDGDGRIDMPSGASAAQYDFQFAFLAHFAFQLDRSNKKILSDIRPGRRSACPAVTGFRPLSPLHRRFADRPGFGFGISVRRPAQSSIVSPRGRSNDCSLT